SMTGDQTPDLTPLHVTVTNQPSRRPVPQNAVYLTITLTPGDATQELLPQSDRRIIALVRALDDDIVIGSNRSDVAVGRGAIVPKANTVATEVRDHNAVYIGVPTFAGASSRVALIATYCDER